MFLRVTGVSGTPEPKISRGPATIGPMSPCLSALLYSVSFILYLYTVNVKICHIKAILLKRPI